MSSFTRACNHGKGRYLISNEIKKSKNIASVRILDERAIQRQKCLQNISRTITFTQFQFKSELESVCYFCNFMKPLVTKVSK